MIGPGDDCAVVRLPDDRELCVSVDTLISGVHFPQSASPEMVASRAMGVNLSDLAAMGATPYGFTLALTLPVVSENWLSGFSRRLHELIATYRLPLLGGNLTRGELSLTVNIMGLVPVGKSLLRSTAKPGDDIYVSGNLGNGAGGLAMALGQVETKHGELLEAYSNPVPRIALGCALLGLASAAIDISDGFSADLGHLCEASDCGALVWLDSIPISDDLITTFGQDKARAMAIQGGDDYELCFTVPATQASAIADLARFQGLSLSRVGKIRSGAGIEIVDSEGRSFESTGGYKHFS